jgi:uncharacterized protein with ATP-grasp and redox domains
MRLSIVQFLITTRFFSDISCPSIFDPTKHESKAAKFTCDVIADVITTDSSIESVALLNFENQIEKSDFDVIAKCISNYATMSLIDMRNFHGFCKIF